MFNFKNYGFMFFVITAVAFITMQARAIETNDAWGDLGYTNPGPVVEEIPETISEDAPTLSISGSTTLASRSDGATVDLLNADIREAPTAAPKKRASNITSVENTYGVMTEEKPGVMIYMSPFGGVASAIGNDTSDSTPKYAFGATGGLLVSSNMLIFGSYTYDVQGFSRPRVNSTNGYSLVDGNVYDKKQSTIEAGLRLYILGRESRVRPYIAGGFGWSRATLNYTAANLQVLSNNIAFYGNDFLINQFNGMGELGAEVAITKNFVANASFKLRGVLSNSTSGGDSKSAQNYDPGKNDVGNSLSRTASYVIGAGVGVYF